MDQIVQEIKEIIKETLIEKDQELDLNSNIMETYDVDSVDLSRILYDIEQKYQISFSPREVSTLKTINDYANIIKSKLDN